jgi:FimV-like protein
VHRKTLEQKMSRGQNPLMLMMALSLPGAAHALGLGEIHVDSALNEPLAAEIDIVGATAEELEGLTATVASRDTFLKFGADRPAFLSTATFKVAHDARGRPVLSIRSTDSFTEPVVNMVVDLRWHNGEVIRQYSLLLDPAGFPTAIQQATAITAAAPAAPVTIPRSTLTALPASAAHVTTSEVPASVDAASASNTDVSASKSSRKMTHVKVGSKATLRGVAWRVGARSDVDLKKTMLAIFRANPSAFEANINILHLGASLTIPSEEVIAAIPADEAKREIRAQMAAWRAMPKSSPNGVPTRLAKAPSAQPAAVAATAPTTVNYSVTAPKAVVAPAATAATTATDAELNQRIQTLEQGLHDMQNQVQRENDKLVGVQAQLKYEEKAAESASAAAAEIAVAHPSRLPAIFGGLTLLAGALAAIYWKLRRRPAPKASPKVELTPEPFLERSADLTPTHTVAAEPVRREPPRTPQRPIMTEDGLELSAAWNSVRDKQEAKVRAQLTAALSTAAERSQSVLTVSEEELHAAYEDTLDLSSETAILAAEIAAASGDTAMLAAATVQLSSEALQEAADAAMAETSVNETAIMDPSSTNNVATIRLKQAGDSEPTVEHVLFNQADDANAETMLSNPGAMSVDGTKLDYNLTDLDLSNGHHVQMPSMLHEHVVVKERRTNLVDVLKKAIEREPDRSDLRMKLLETYYAAAATNRQGFLEVVQNLARERDRLGEGEWDKIAYMGKQIASDTGLFDTDVVSVEDDKLADCA